MKMILKLACLISIFSSLAYAQPAAKCFRVSFRGQDGMGALNELIRLSEYPAEALAAGYILNLTSNQLQQLHLEFPTNYPPTLFVPRLAKVQYGTAD